MKEKSEYGTNFDFGKSDVLAMDNGDECEVFFPESPRERLLFENEFCSFKPDGWVRLNTIWFPVAYKVVTEDLKSLGLKRNPTILTYPIGEWVNLPDSEVVPGMETDIGGIFTALRKGGVKKIFNHYWGTWGLKSRGFLVAINNPVGDNGYRIKSQGVIMLKEIMQEIVPRQE